MSEFSVSKPTNWRKRIQAHRECINCGKEFLIPLDANGQPARRKTCSKRCEGELKSWEASQTLLRLKADPERYEAWRTCRDYAEMARKSSTLFTSERAREIQLARWAKYRAQKEESR